MNHLVDHNDLLEEIASTNNEEALARLAECTLRPSTILNVVSKTKNYSLLSLLKNFDFEKHGCVLLTLEAVKMDPQKNEIYSIAANAIKDGTFAALEPYLPLRLEAGGLSFACGSLDVDFDLIPKHFQHNFDYMQGIVKNDNIKLLRQFLDQRPLEIKIVLYLAGRYYARQIAAHYGLLDEYVESYLNGAFSGGNKEALLFVGEQIDGKDFQSKMEKVFLSFVASWQMRPSMFPFFIECFQEGIITLSEEGWQRLKHKHIELYERVQNDV